MWIRERIPRGGRPWPVQVGNPPSGPPYRSEGVWGLLPGPFSVLRVDPACGFWRRKCIGSVLSLVPRSLQRSAQSHNVNHGHPAGLPAPRSGRQISVLLEAQGGLPTEARTTTYDHRVVHARRYGRLDGILAC